MTFEPGNPWMVCQFCGGQERFDVMKKGVAKRQKGLDVCPSCYDPKELSDKPKMSSRKEHQPVEVI